MLLAVGFSWFKIISFFTVMYSIVMIVILFQAEETKSAAMQSSGKNKKKTGYDRLSYQLERSTKIDMESDEEDDVDQFDAVDGQTGEGSLFSSIGLAVNKIMT